MRHGELQLDLNWFISQFGLRTVDPDFKIFPCFAASQFKNS